MLYIFGLRLGRTALKVMRLLELVRGCRSYSCVARQFAFRGKHPNTRGNNVAWAARDAWPVCAIWREHFAKLRPGSRLLPNVTHIKALKAVQLACC
ncbi:unnamed protein product [Amoebophrya sp. A25]|nr:unnamed protein product [Amoebophrya sp. A25]|eukprot:GSA25T00025828001.1